VDQLKKEFTVVRPMVIAASICWFSTNSVWSQLAYPLNRPVGSDSTSQSETSIAVSPVNDNNVATGWNVRSTTGDVSGFGHSTDGGITWTGEILTDINNPKGIDPSVAFDRFGNVYFCHIGGNATQNWIRVWRKVFTGSSWSQVQVSNTSIPNHVLDNDKPYMAIDNSGFTSNNIYVAWSEYFQTQVGNRIQFVRSTDGGSDLSPIYVPS
jgi:hypothetical protein